jgi:hypothetical protein
VKIFELFNISELKNRIKKSIDFLYTKKDNKQVKMIFILTNLFTTLQCQRTTIRDKLTFAEAALQGEG